MKDKGSVLLYTTGLIVLSMLVAYLLDRWVKSVLVV